jgi:TatD DNase family protein
MTSPRRAADQPLERDVPPLPAPLAGEVADSHCHFDAMAQRAGVELDADFIATVVEQARSVGVTRMINVGCEVEHWQTTIESTENPAVYGAIAVHPTEVTGLTHENYAELEQLLRHPKIVAVGETGLDYYWDRTTPIEQQEHFRRHIDLSKRVGKPLMIHDRQAHADVLQILREEGAPAAGVVFHAFSGGEAMARECAEAGYVMSFAGVLTFKNAATLREAAAVAPLDQILVETDAPFLTAHPHRGRPNAPYLIPHVVRLLASLHEVPESEVCATLHATFARFFRVK